MNEKELCNILANLLNNACIADAIEECFADYDLDPWSLHTQTYEHRGVERPGADAGITISLEDGSEFAFSCVRRTWPNKS